MGLIYNPSIVTDDLVLYLDAANPKSYPGTGTTWYDLSGNGNNGTLVNGVGYDATNKGSMTFDGVNDYITRSAINVSYLTVSAWINWSNFISGNSGYAIISNCSSSSNGFMLYQNAESPYNKYIFFLVASGIQGISSNILLSTNTWYNITVTYNGNYIICYTNGIYDNQVEKSGGPISTNPSNFLLGKVGYSDSFFPGKISQVSIHNRALTAQEIQHNFNATRSRYNI